MLVVAELDRLSRSPLDFDMLMNRARREDWELVVVDLAVDTTVSSGQLKGNAMAAFVEYEHQLVGAHTSAAFQQLKARGKRLSCLGTLCAGVTARIVAARG